MTPTPVQNYNPGWNNGMTATGYDFKSQNKYVSDFGGNSYDIQSHYHH